MVEIDWRRETIGFRVFMSFLRSDFFVSRPREKRTELWAISASPVIDIMTWDGSRSPEAQAEPVETAKPARSR